MENSALEILRDVFVGVAVNVITPVVTPVVTREWEEGWKRDYEAGGISYQEPEEETAFEGA